MIRTDANTSTLASNACPFATFLQGRITASSTKARNMPELAGSYAFASSELRLALHEHRALCPVCMIGEAEDEHFPQSQTSISHLCARPLAVAQ